MARHEIVTLVDDLTGEDAVTTIDFGLDGVDYQMDASEPTARRLRSVLGRYVGAARKVGAARSTMGMHRPATGGNNGQRLSAHAAEVNDRAYRDDVRAWARQHGVTYTDAVTGKRKHVGSKGRLPAVLCEAYARQQPDGAPHPDDVPPADEATSELPNASRGAAYSTGTPAALGNGQRRARHASPPVFSNAPESASVGTNSQRTGNGTVNGTPPTGDVQAAAPSQSVVRQWARDHGLPVNARGSIAPEVHRAYRERRKNGAPRTRALRQ